MPNQIQIPNSTKKQEDDQLAQQAISFAMDAIVPGSGGAADGLTEAPKAPAPLQKPNDMMQRMEGPAPPPTPIPPAELLKPPQAMSQNNMPQRNAYQRALDTQKMRMV